MMFEMNSKTAHNQNRRSSLQKWARLCSNFSMLALLIGVLCFMCMLMMMSFILRDSKSTCLHDSACDDKENPNYDGLTSEQCTPTCDTEECLKTATYIMSNMDDTVDPCDNFYEYACGNEQKEFSNMVTAIGDMAKTVTRMIENVGSGASDQPAGVAMTKIKQIYDTCIDKTKNEALAVPTLLRVLDEIGIKNWPNLDDDFAFPRLDDTLSYLLMYGSYTFFELLYEARNESYPGHYSFEVSSESRLLFLGNLPNYEPRDYKFETIRATAVLREFIPEAEDAQDIVGDIVEFEDKAKHLDFSSKERRNAFNPDDAQKAIEFQVDFSQEQDESLELWISVLRKYFILSGHQETYQHSEVLIQDKMYFKELNDLFNQTSPKTLAHAFALSLFVGNLGQLNHRFKEIDDKYSSSLKHQGYDSNVPAFGTAVSCTFWLAKHLPLPLSSQYYTSEFNKENLRESKEIFKILNGTLTSLIRNSSWLNEDFKDAMEKYMIDMGLGLDLYIEIISNVTAVEDYYSQLQATDESFFHNVLLVRKFQSSRTFMKYDQVPLYFEALKNPVMLEAFMSFSRFNENEPPNTYYAMSFLRFPILEENRPRYLNLGLFGSIAAHELGHLTTTALSSRLNPLDNRTLTNFKRGMSCLTEQYSEFQMEDVKVDGARTVLENLADQIGLANIVKSFDDHQGDFGFQGRLPGLNLNEKQLMILFSTQIFCETNELEFFKEINSNDPHSYGKFRILGPLQNMESFSEAFNCPIGSYMNPVKKCNFLA